jgi:signal transduction histidine kinase
LWRRSIAAHPSCVALNRIRNFVGVGNGVAPPFVVAICDDLSDMELIAKERDRLLQRTARFLGLAGTIIALIGLSFPGVVRMADYFVAIPFLLVLVACQIMVARNRPLLWAIVGIIAGLAALVVLRLPLGSSPSSSLGTAVIPLAGAGIASFALVLVSSAPRIILLVVGGVLSTILVQFTVPHPAALTVTSLSVLLGWVLTSVLGYWLSASVPRAARRIYSIGKAHRAERQASETEAQRRQGARLLHDTVLATLTLLAHSGVGVAPEALRQQAAEDARLLRQLRLGATPTPESSGPYNLTPVEETPLGTTLESVKQRFGRMGLEVSWHGTGQVLLPSDVLDAFLLSLAECLENVRRHSGVTQAHVTITDDATTVRAMVTDSGVGFDLEGIDDDKFGFRESVIGRLREVGGNARLFSSPGSGTTVVLEVPR